MLISIKGMVCDHCIEAVKQAFANAGIPGAEVSLGEARTGDTTHLTDEHLAALDKELGARGFTRLSDPDAQLIERIKRAIIHHVREDHCKFNLSACLADNLTVDYSAVSKLFSSREGRTIEKYAIAQRIEYVKELLAYRELNISEIADKVGYSSVAHLSRQFKSVTGLTPTAYLKSEHTRTPINRI